MKHIKITPFNKVLFIAIVVGISVLSCKKEYTSTAVITVTDVVGTPVAGAHVSLHATDAISSSPTNNQTYIKDLNGNDPVGLTDGSGKITFIFKNEAIFTIESYKAVTDSLGADTLKGISRIKLVDNEKVTETVVLRN